MDIHIKQKEIEVAIEDYIASQGINLVNKTVAMAFTAGRGGSGISVDINIDEDISTPKTTTLGSATQRAEALAKAAAEVDEEVIDKEKLEDTEVFAPTPDEPIVSTKAGESVVEKTSIFENK